MIKLKFAIDYTDGRHVDVLAGPGTQVAFEREFKVGITDLVDIEKTGEGEEDRKVHFMTSHIYWMAWHASKTGITFEEWLETLDAVAFDVDAPTPTRPAQPAAS